MYMVFFSISPVSSNKATGLWAVDLSTFSDSYVNLSVGLTQANSLVNHLPVQIFTVRHRRTGSQLASAISKCTWPPITLRYCVAKISKSLVMADLENSLHLETPEMNWEEVERAIKSWFRRQQRMTELWRMVVKQWLTGWWSCYKKSEDKTGTTGMKEHATLVPIHMKRDWKVCVNYWGLSMLNVPGKVLTLSLLARLQAIIEPQLMEAQCGFREGLGTWIIYWWLYRWWREPWNSTPLCWCVLWTSQKHITWKMAVHCWLFWNHMGFTLSWWT